MGALVVVMIACALGGFALGHGAQPVVLPRIERPPLGIHVSALEQLRSVPALCPSAGCGSG